MKQPVTVLIADDEPLAREAIRLRLQQHNEFEHSDFQVIAEADNGSDASILIQTMTPDVVFMDINMPKLTGLEAAEKLMAHNAPCLVFITAYEQHALKAFRLNALDYVTKPIKDEVFNDVLQKLKKRISEKRAQKTLNTKHQLKEIRNHYLKRISIKEEDDIHLFETRDIESVTSVKDYLCLKIKGKIYIQRQTMKQLSALLDPEIFIHCHRSHIVNIRFVSKWLEQDANAYLVCNGEKHPVSRRLRKEVKSRLKI